MMTAATTRSTITPCLTYADAPAAIDWLCANFGFVRHAVYAEPDGTIRHAELTLGNSMIMLGSADRDSWYGKLMALPNEIGGRQTQSISVYVSDPDAICRRAKAAGAQILLDIEDKPYGGRSFSCRDSEGHVWSFGSYDPWQAK